MKIFRQNVFGFSFGNLKRSAKIFARVHKTFANTYPRTPTTAAGSDQPLLSPGELFSGDTTTICHTVRFS